LLSETLFLWLGYSPDLDVFVTCIGWFSVGLGLCVCGFFGILVLVLVCVDLVLSLGLCVLSLLFLVCRFVNFVFVWCVL